MPNKRDLLGVPGASRSGIIGTATGSLTAAGTTQATALVLNDDVNVLSTVSAGSGAILPAGLEVGDSVIVANMGANTLLVYPPVGVKFNNYPVNIPCALLQGRIATFTCVDASNANGAFIVQ